jgi:hypothetical protein
MGGPPGSNGGIPAALTTRLVWGVVIVADDLLICKS